MKEAFEKQIAAMREKGFEIVCVKTAQEAQDFLMEAIPAGAQVGVGGSVSVRETGILPKLTEKGCIIHSHWGAAAEEVPAILRRAREADVYLCSANAVTADGKLVFIDGRGNRIGAICDGPQNVYFVISHSKLVDGGTEAAWARIKREACPQNARRLGLHTPCALSGKCSIMECEKTSCCLTLVLEHAPHLRHMTVVLVEEKLGY